MKALNVLSPFNGVSCGRVAAGYAELPINRYVSYEIDKDANTVAKFNYPDDEYNGDVFKADFKQYNGFDLLIGGSPCTYWSIARARSDDSRETTSSGFGFELFMQYVRALHESKSRWFLYENNASISKEIQAEISNQLGVQPIKIDSGDLSAQTRERLYWTNIPIHKEYKKQNIVFEDIMETDGFDMKSFEKYKDTVKINDDDSIVYWDTSGKGNYSQQNRARKPFLKMNTLPSSGNDKNNIWLGECNFRKILPVESERLQTLPDGYTSCIKSKIKRTELCGNGWTAKVIAWFFENLKIELEK